MLIVNTLFQGNMPSGKKMILTRAAENMYCIGPSFVELLDWIILCHFQMCQQTTTFYFRIRFDKDKEYFLLSAIGAM